MIARYPFEKPVRVSAQEVALVVNEALCGGVNARSAATLVLISGVLMSGCAGNRISLAPGGATATSIFQSAGYVITPPQEATINALPAPRLAAVPGQDSCKNTSLSFETDAAQSEWNSAAYSKMLFLYAVAHAGGRAGKSGTPECRDLEYGAKLWQSAIGHPVSGRLSDDDVARFVAIVDRYAPGYAEAHQRHSGQPHAVSSADVPRAEVAAAQATPVHPEPSYSGAVRLDELEMGSGFEQLTAKLPAAICAEDGQHGVLCSAESHCLERYPRPRPTADSVAENLLGMMSGRQTMSRQDMAYRQQIAECEAAFKQSAAGHIEMSYLGVPVAAARLTFSNGIYTGLRLDAGEGATYSMRTPLTQPTHRYSSRDLNKALTLRLGEPKVDSSYATYVTSSYQCDGQYCGNVPEESVTTVTEYTWRTQTVRAHQSGNLFEVDLLPSR